MFKNFTRLLLYLTLLTTIGVASALHASAQTGPIVVQPTAIYRFQISYWDGGHLLTTNFQEGSANGYTFDPFNLPSFDGMGICTAVGLHSRPIHRTGTTASLESYSERMAGILLLLQVFRQPRK